jgi:nuclear transport factor 2 (NTF2) superfamily protein
MTATEALELARAYVALSNAHRVDLIGPMFATDAVYRSSAVGEYHGTQAIIEMMRSFFERFPDVFWLCDNYQCSQNRVGFEFQLQATEADSGQSISRGGHECIEFDSAGLIRLIEVQAA